MRKIKKILFILFVFSLAITIYHVPINAHETIVNGREDQMPSRKIDGAYWYNAVWEEKGAHWSKTRVVADRVLDARSFFIPSETEEEALLPLYDWRKQSNWQSLNGNWDFKLVSKPDQVIENFHEENFVLGSDWLKMPVPASWQLHNNGIGDEPMYSNWYYHWTQKGYLKIEGKPNIEGEGLDYWYAAIATAPKNYNPVGHYITHFKIDPSKKNDQIILNFQGVESAFYVYVNGHYVGYSEDTFSQHEFDITKFIHKDKENKLAVLVYRWSDGSLLENQDLVNYSGIFRDVGLIYRSSKASLLDFSNDVTLQNNNSKAILKTSYKVSNNTKKVEVKLFDSNNQLMKSDVAKLVDNKFVSELVIDNPQLWSSEHPNLYKQVIIVYDENGNVGEYVGYHVGMREISLINTDNGKTTYAINGKPLVFKGVNRHELDNDYGRNVRIETIHKDLSLMKQNNVNAIRMSHYPNGIDIYILADYYGIMIMDEANLETHAAGGLAGIPMAVETFRYPSLHRGSNMYERDKNFPSVVSWSNGNECIFFAPPKVNDNYSFRLMYKYIKERDSKRPIVLERDPREGITDIRSRMYWPASEYSVGYSIFEGIPGNDKKILEDKDKRPYLQVEYAHSMGNSLGYYKEYWDLWRQYPHAMGGFIWDWVDQSPLWPIPNDKKASGPSYDSKGNKVANGGTHYLAYGGDWAKDKNNNFNNFMDNGLISSDRIPHDSRQQMKFVQQDILFSDFNKDNNTVKVKNEFNFTNLNQYQFSLSVLKDGKEIDFSNGEKELNFNVELAPRSSAIINLPDYKSQVQLNDNASYYLVLKVKLKNVGGNTFEWAKAGNEIAFGEFLIKQVDKTLIKAPIDTTLGNVIDDKTDLLTISNSRITFKLDKFSGQWVEFSKDGVQFFANKNDGTKVFKTTDNRPMDPGMYANFWRPPVDNDRENGWLSRVARWRESNFWRRNIHVEVNSSNPNVTTVSVTSRFDNNSDLKEVYTVYSDGHINYAQNIDPTRRSEIPSIGTMFELKKEFNQLTYYGRGPATTFVDRWEGYPHGIYSEKVDFNSLGNYVKPQENGNHVGVEWAKITNANGQGLFVKSNNSELEVMGSPFNQYDITDSSHPYELSTTNRTYFRVNYKTQGVGGENSWGARPLPYATINAKPYNFDFDIFPIGTNSIEKYPDNDSDLYKTVRSLEKELIKEVFIQRADDMNEEKYNNFKTFKYDYVIDYVDGQKPNLSEARIVLNDEFVNDYEIVKDYEKDDQGNRTNVVILTVHKKGADNSNDVKYRFTFLGKKEVKEKIIQSASIKRGSSSNFKNLETFKEEEHQYYFNYVDGQDPKTAKVKLSLYDEVKDKYDLVYSKFVNDKTSPITSRIQVDVVLKTDKSQIIDSYNFVFQGYPYSVITDKLVKEAYVKRFAEAELEKVDSFSEENPQYKFKYQTGQNPETAEVKLILFDEVKDLYEVKYEREQKDGKLTGNIIASVIEKSTGNQVRAYIFEFEKGEDNNSNQDFKLIDSVSIKRSNSLAAEEYKAFKSEVFEYVIDPIKGQDPKTASVIINLTKEASQLYGVRYISEKDANGQLTGVIKAEIYDLKDSSKVIKTYIFTFKPYLDNNSNDKPDNNPIIIPDKDNNQINPDRVVNNVNTILPNTGFVNDSLLLISIMSLLAGLIILKKKK